MTARIRTPKRRLTLALLAAMALTAAGTGAADTPREALDLELRAATFELNQQNYFSALDELAAARRLPGNEQRNEDSTLTLAGLYLSLGLPNEAEHALRDLSDKRAAVPERAWLNLARLLYQRGHLAEAEEAISHLRELSPGPIQIERDYLLTLVYLSRKRYEEAIAVSKTLEGTDELSLLGRYNRAIALLYAHRVQEGLSTLEQLAQNPIPGDAAAAIREHANVLLGYYLLDHHDYDHGRAALMRAQQSKGRLGAGWLEYESGKQDTAVKRWASLAQGDSRDTLVQEAQIALPRAQYQLKNYSAATLGYEQALHSYADEDKHLNAAITAINDGNLLAALVKTDEENAEPNWYRIQSTLPNHPAAYYVRDTLASHAFQESFKNYRDLLYLRERLATYGEDIKAYLSLINAQQQLHGQRRNEIMARNDQLAHPDIARLAQKYKDELARAEAGGDSSLLATTEQKRQLYRLQRIDARLPKLRDSGFIDLQRIDEKYHLLRGLLITDLASQYQQHLWDTKKAMKELDQALAEFAVAQDKFRLAVAQAKKQIIGGQDNVLKTLRDRQTRLLAQTDGLIGEQRTYLTSLMTREVRERRTKLDQYMTQAQVGIAQAYDQLLAAGGKKGDYAQALAAYRRVLDASGDSPVRRDALVRMAMLEMAQADQRDATRLPRATQEESRAINIEIAAHYQKAAALLEDALKRGPVRPDDDRVLYLLAKAYDHNGDSDRLLQTLERLVREYPASTYADEAHFRRGELLFSQGLPQQAAEAYGAIVTRGATSPFYEKALYMHGWSLYESSRYAPALESFLTLLDHKLGAPHPTRIGKAATPNLSAGDQEIVNDVLRVSALSLSQLNGVQSVERYFAQREGRGYEYLLYEALANLYLTQERIEDAAKVYRAYVAKYPEDPHAPEFESRVLAAYQKGGFTSLLLTSKEEYVRRYRPDSAYWSRNPDVERGLVLAQVRDYMQELARYHHARAQSTKQADEYHAAEEAYRSFLSAYPNDPQAIEMRFLLAESLYESGRYDEALQEYQRVAYESPANPHSVEAAYAAALSYQKSENGLAGEALAGAQRRTVAALQRFAATYPQDPRAAAALAKSAELLFGLKDNAGAEIAARQVIADSHSDSAQRLSAWRIIAHSEFEAARYAEAEKSYQAALLLTTDQPARRDLEERLAAAVYKQGEAALAQGDRRAAVQHFLRVDDVAPDASIRVNADYDAAANLLALEAWQEAIPVLEAFRKNYPTSPLQKDLPAKLTLAYQKIGDWRHAADELELIAARGDNADIKRDALWQAADSYSRAQLPREALRVYQEYVRGYPQPLSDAVEAHQRIADIYAQQGDTAAQRHWLARLITVEQQGGAARNDRSRTLAAQASLLLAQDRYEQFATIKLSHPLEKSLKLKKKAMENALQAYNKAAAYGIADVTTAATYHSAEIYAQFSKDLLASERPQKLSGLELEQYNVLLEEQAYPFEEKAIALYEANTRRAADHVYDEWVKKSYTALSTLLPARYAKVEKGEPVIDELY